MTSSNFQMTPETVFILFFIVLNLGQMLMWHIVLLPIAAVILTALHVLMVRVKGVVPPYEDETKVA